MVVPRKGVHSRRTAELYVVGCRVEEPVGEPALVSWSCCKARQHHGIACCNGTSAATRRLIHRLFHRRWGSMKFVCPFDHEVFMAISRCVASLSIFSRPGVTEGKKQRAVKKTEVPTVEAAPKVKSKLVRDSVTIPKTEYLVLDLLKSRAVGLKRPTKKSELLRAGIALLHTLNDAAFLSALGKYWEYEGSLAAFMTRLADAGLVVP